MAGTERQTDGEVLERTRQETKKPDLFKVLLLNDDYTTMDFVVEVLETSSTSSRPRRYRIMMAVHTQGKGLCGVYPFEVAETKVATVVDLARGKRLSAARRDGTGITVNVQQHQMFSQALEIVLTVAYREATARRHTHLTLEHLLYALAHDPGRRADPRRLRRRSAAAPARSRQVSSTSHSSSSRRGQQKEPEQTLAFRRVLQTAVLHVQSAGRQEVQSGDVLAATLQQTKSYAAQLLAGAGHHRGSTCSSTSRTASARCRRRARQRPTPIRRRATPTPAAASAAAATARDPLVGLRDEPHRRAREPASSIR